MANAIKYVTSELSPVILTPPISPIDVPYIQFFYEGSPIIEFPYHLKIVLINTIENHENTAIFKSQIISHFVLCKMITIEEFHNANLKTIDVLQKALNSSEHEYLKIHEISIPPLPKTIDGVIDNYDLLSYLIVGD